METCFPSPENRFPLYGNMFFCASLPPPSLLIRHLPARGEAGGVLINTLIEVVGDWAKVEVVLRWPRGAPSRYL